MKFLSQTINNEPAANLMFAAIEGDNEYAIFNENTSYRLIIANLPESDDTILCEEWFSTLKEAVEKACDFIKTEYEGA